MQRLVGAASLGELVVCQGRIRRAKVYSLGGELLATATGPD